MRPCRAAFHHRLRQARQAVELTNPVQTRYTLLIKLLSKVLPTKYGIQTVVHDALPFAADVERLDVLFVSVVEFDGV